MFTVSFSPTKSELPAGKTIVSRFFLSARTRGYFSVFSGKESAGVCVCVGGERALSKVTSNLHISIQSEIKDMEPAQATLEVYMLKTPALKS